MKYLVFLAIVLLGKSSNLKRFPISTKKAFLVIIFILVVDAGRPHRRLNQKGGTRAGNSDSDSNSNSNSASSESNSNESSQAITTPETITQADPVVDTTVVAATEGQLVPGK